MSSGVFTSKQYKSFKNLKKLSISSPISASPNTSPQTASFPVFRSNNAAPVVIFKVNYSFRAESPAELSVNANDYLKLVDRPGNGWLMVQRIDRNASGLIPALYVEIAVNDVTNPVSIEWLNEANQVQEPEYPRLTAITNVLQNSKARYWYRMDILMSSGKQVFIGKYYQDFYNLHICLISIYSKALPSLPKPMRTASTSSGFPVPWKESDNSHMLDLVERCRELDNYFSQLLNIPEISKCEEMLQFINDEQFKRVEVGANEIPPSEDQINDLLFKDSINITAMLNPSRKFSPTAPLPPISLGRSFVSGTKSFNDLSKYTSPKNMSHLNMSHIHLLTKQAEVPHMTESKSSQTISSFGSLIAGYDDDEESLSLINTYSPRRGTSSGSGKRVSIPAPLEYAAPHSQHASHGSTSTIGTPKMHYSSGTDSLMSAGSTLKSSSTPEPRTPVLDHAFEQPYTAASPTTHIIEEECDFDLSPLQPKMHKEILISNSSSSSTIIGDSGSPDLATGEYIKVKVALCNKEDDKIVLRVRRSELTTLMTLKKLLLFKIYKDSNLIHHYKLRPLEHHDKNMTDSEVLEYVKTRSKVNLRLQRART